MRNTIKNGELVKYSTQLHKGEKDWKRNVPEKFKNKHPYRITNLLLETMEDHYDFIKRIKDDGITNRLYKVEGYLSNTYYTEPNIYDGRIMDLPFIEVNGRVYTNESIWSENENEYVELVWYNVDGLRERDIDDHFIDNNFMSMDETPGSFIHITEEEFLKMMNNKLILTDEERKKPKDVEPLLLPMILDLGYNQVLEKIDKDYLRLKTTMDKMSSWKTYEPGKYHTSKKWIMEYNRE
jgi:hypothetical protein